MGMYLLGHVCRRRAVDRFEGGRAPGRRDLHRRLPLRAAAGGVRSVAAGEHPEGVSRAGGRARAHASHLRNVGSGDAALRRGAGRPASAEEPVDRRAPRRAQPRWPRGGRVRDEPPDPVRRARIAGGSLDGLHRPDPPAAVPCRTARVEGDRPQRSRCDEVSRACTSRRGPSQAEIVRKDGKLHIQFASEGEYLLAPVAPTRFRLVGASGLVLVFDVEGGAVRAARLLTPEARC